MRAKLVHMNLKNAYGHEESFYVTDNQLEILEFILNKSFNRDNGETKKPGSKEMAKFKEEERAMAKAKHLIANANRILKEYNQIKSMIRKVTYEIPDSVISSELKQVENKIQKDAMTQIKEATKLIQKYGKNYTSNLKVKPLPVVDNRGNHLEASKYALSGNIKSFERLTTNDLIYDLSINLDEKQIVQEVMQSYSEFYANEKNNTIQNFPWEVPEIEFLNTIIDKTDDKKEIRKLESAKKFYEELQKAKRKLYTYGKVKNILENSVFIKKYMTNAIDRLNDMEQKSKKIVDKYENEMKSQEFITSKKEINKISSKIKTEEKEQENLSSIKQKIQEKEIEIEKLKQYIENLKQSTLYKKLDFENNQQEAYKTRYIPERTRVTQINKDIYDPVTLEEVIPGHSEYIYNEEEREHIMGNSKEVYDDSKEKLKEQETLLEMLKQELNNLKVAEASLTKKFDSAKKDYTKKTFLEKAKEKLKNKLDKVDVSKKF